MFVSYKKFSHYPVIFAFICGKITNANVINTVAGEHCTTNNLTENLGRPSLCVLKAELLKLESFMFKNINKYF